MRPLLLPGAHPLRRADDRLQIGLARAGAVVVRGRPRPPAPDVLGPDTLPPLLKHGVALPDERPLRTALPAEAPNRIGRRSWHRHTLAALARRTGHEFPQALARRGEHPIEVVAFGHPRSADLAQELTRLLELAGLEAHRDDGPRPRAATPPSARPLTALVGVGEPSRELTDRHLHDGTPHLLVRLTEGAATVGPFVVPGRTACLRCIDAFHTESDTSWPLLVEQYARATRSDRADGIPEPVDVPLAATALGWAARDLATYAEGGTPTSWSSTVRLSPVLDSIETRGWPTHPDCGCSWT